MPTTIDAASIATMLAAAVALALVVLFFVGMQLNLTRGQAALRWLRTGLTVVAQKTTMRWLGSSVVQLGMTDPHPPFKQVDVLVMLEPRDVAVMWLLARRNGRRDTLILRGHLRRNPRHEGDLLDAASWSGKEALAHHTPPEWERVQRGDLTLASESAAASAVLHEIEPMVQRMGGPLLRCSVRRTVPHLELHLGAPWAGAVDSKVSLQVFKDIAKLLSPQA